MCFPVRFSKFLRRPTLSEQMLEWNEPKKNCIHKIYLQENTSNGVIFSAVADM